MSLEKGTDIFGSLIRKNRNTTERDVISNMNQGEKTCDSAYRWYFYLTNGALKINLVDQFLLVYEYSQMIKVILDGCKIAIIVK